jgi:hypothetical protein
MLTRAARCRRRCVRPASAALRQQGRAAELWRTIANCAPPSATNSGVTTQAEQVNTSTISVCFAAGRDHAIRWPARPNLSGERGIVAGMSWDVVYRRRDGEHVTEYASSEAAARQNFAKWVKAAPAEAYTFVRLVRDGVVVQSWPDP